MSSLFRSINNYSVKRENAIKEALINTLSENSREIEYEAKQSGREQLDLCECTSALCMTLEAIFLHGLKDSFLWQTITVIAGDVERRPEPSFWSPIMVFMHKQVIKQIQSLSQITSEIGQCRAWIRLSLNDSLFSSYLNIMRKNTKALSPYYKKYALLKDSEGLEMAAKLMEGIEAYLQFDLPTNSSLLNNWPDYSLQLSGLWTPALKSCPISSGIDIAGSLTTETMAIPTPQPLRTNELFSESISNSPFSRPSNFGVLDINQRENMDLFLQKIEEMDIISEEDIEKAQAANNTSPNKIANKKESNKKRRKHLKDNTELNATEGATQTNPYDLSNYPHSTHSNSLTNLMQTSWSSDANSESAHALTTPTDETGHGRYVQRSVSMSSSTSSLRSPLGDRCSYNALLKKHERNRDVDWMEVWEKFLIQNTAMMTNTDADGTQTTDTLENDLENFSNESQVNSDFEILSNSAIDKFDIVELQEMVEQLCQLARESGLDAQGFLCKSCQHPLGIGYNNLRVCAFSGNYFCDACMNVKPMLIPAKIIYNWDFRKYNVSKRSAEFLTEFRYQPFIDLKLLNPHIYHAAEAMAELQSLRIRLNFIRAYLYTCCTASIDKLQRQFFGKDYLYEHIHQYSIDDLEMIPRGTLHQNLQKAYKIGESHVLKCGLCSLKGFICEICNSPRVLYPFHIDTTYRCEMCGAVFHAHCLNDKQPCPKCERKRKREDLPLLEAVQNSIE
ncbi:uncharacterized protein LOC119679671 [Teleopsis dalmanni]|uniref:uncharacterized protein LOC119679671 n=1 Tax=Teleopsis dalmanni TaxID=139649 RepID=UPI0018CE627C|nr:uncharacterized protein LOC119679671 [Teleopsis dalmanni]